MIWENILIYFVVIPVLTLAGLAICKNIKQVRAVSIVGASALMVLGVYVLIEFLQLRAAGNTAEMLFCGDWSWIEPLNIKLSLGVDGISVAMLLLSCVIVFAGVFASWNMDPLPREYFMWFWLLSTGVFGFFIAIDLFTMFMFYEVALIPMYLLIGVWGSGNKNYSAMKLTLMLMGASALLMLGIIGIYFHSAADGNLTMNILEIAKNNAIPHNWQYFLFPMIFFILTGISVVYGAFSACVQTDLKYINAYSSVSHCGMVLFAILMLNTTAMTGAIMQMLSHGLMTALFFALIGMIYGRTHTRDIRKMGGLMQIMPFLGVGYVIAGLANLGLPGFSGFVAEMTIFVGSFAHADMFHRVLTIMACSAIVITAVYILRVVGKMLYGPVYDEHHRELTDAVWHEKFAVITLIVCVAGLGCFPNFFNEIIYDSFAPIIKALGAF